MMDILLIAAAMAALQTGQAPSPASTPPPVRPGPPAAEAVADEVWLIPGGLTPGRQPDGNTVVFGSDAGLVVFDTGRHAWHLQGIRNFLAGDGRPLAAVVNSHWHLDHVSGDDELKAEHPGAVVLASGAIDGAIEGFLRPSAVDGRRILAEGQLPPSIAEDVTNDLATIDHAEALKPDRRIEGDGPLGVADGRLIGRLAVNAATEGDVWVVDPRSGVVAAGDLVTLPSPFMDTACPQGWRAALDTIAETSFTLLIPGHGRPMDRAAFDAYRTAFGRLLDCGASERTGQVCAQEWAEGVASLLTTDRERRMALGMTAQYVDNVLKAPGGRSRFCRAA